MNDNELTKNANELWDSLFSIKNENLPKEQQIELIKSKLIEFGSCQRKLGRRQILNHFKVEVNNMWEEF